MALLKNINDIVQSSDTLYHLGDILFEHKRHEYVKKIEDLRQKINCGDIHLCLGNHDDHGALKGSLRSLFTKVDNILELQVTKKNLLVMCHYPLRIWNQSHRNSGHIFGHTHELVDKYPNEMLYNVGVDLNGLKPISLDELVKIMEIKKQRKDGVAV